MRCDSSGFAFWKIIYRPPWLKSSQSVKYLWAASPSNRTGYNARDDDDTVEKEATSEWLVKFEV
jgi:hypothetical protein